MQQKHHVELIFLTKSHLLSRFTATNDLQRQKSMTLTVFFLLWMAKISLWPRGSKLPKLDTLKAICIHLKLRNCCGLLLFLSQFVGWQETCGDIYITKFLIFEAYTFHYMILKSKSSFKFSSKPTDSFIQKS